MKKADYATLAKILKRYATDAKLSKANGDNAQKIAAQWIAATCDCIAVDFAHGAHVDVVPFLKACTPD
jgi:hypothetical protein